MTIESFNDFSSFIEIFTGLNLAYASSDKFRYTIDEHVLNLKVEFNQSIEKAIAKLFLDKEKNEKKKELIEQSIVHLQVLKENLENKSKKIDYFGDYFRTAFLLTGFFCLTSLLLIPFINKGIFVESSYLILTVFPIVAIVYNLILYDLSFFIDLNRNRKISPNYAIIIFFVIIVSCSIFSLFFPKYNTAIPDTVFTLLITAAISTFALYVFRVLAFFIYIKAKLVHYLIISKGFLYNSDEKWNNKSRVGHIKTAFYISVYHTTILYSKLQESIIMKQIFSVLKKTVKFILWRLFVLIPLLFYVYYLLFQKEVNNYLLHLFSF